MRKYTKFILIFYLINIISNAAYASTLNTGFDDETQTITISGKATDYADSRVFIQVLCPGVNESDIADVTKDNFKSLFSNVFEVQTDSDGYFEAPSYTPQTNGSHSIRIKYGDSTPVLYEDAFFCLTRDYEDNVFFPALNAANNQAIQYITANADIACGFDSNYKYLSEEYLQKASECAIAERNLIMSAKFESKEAFQTVMKASLMINLMENYPDNAADIFKFYAEDATLQDTYSPLMLCGDYVSEENVGRIASDVTDENDYTSVSGFMNVVGEKLILKAIGDVGVYMNVESILTHNEQFFGFNLNDYKKIKDKSYVNEAIAKSNPKNIDELKSVIEREVREHSGDGNISYGGGGGSSSGKVSSSSGGGNVNVNIAPSASDNNSAAQSTPAASSPFTDTEDVMWAKTAIDTLYNKGIINGTSSTQYSPHRNVTREEFIKLLTVAFVPQISEDDVAFSDVKEDDWFYPYIADAYNRGLVKGITDSAFGTGLPITRQDMAVFVYRYALAFSNADAFVHSKSFSDSEIICDYAKEAAEKLAGASVISGMGNGSFEPFGLCNRAQAAVIIYNLIKFMEG